MKNKQIKRVIWIVLDSVGMGELPDAAEFDDVGANTIGNIVKLRGKLNLPNMKKLGYGNIDGMQGIEPIEKPIGGYGRLMELSHGKDTTIGHWEMIGIHTPVAFPTYPDGFPKEIIDEFCEKCGFKGVLGNKVASGTEIIKELGEQHIKTGMPIVYTSADSVFQVAAHEDIISPEHLWEICETARKILSGKNEVARVIARPFIGQEGNYTRTANRRDFSKKPSKDNLLSYMKDSGQEVVGVGKIEDIFAKQGITKARHTKSNADGMEVTFEYMDEVKEGLIFTNLVEFDSSWGHRRDVDGYANGLEEFDRYLGKVLNFMKESDLLIITADHGCDPTFKGTDHTREYVPLLVYHKNMKQGINFGTGKTFANIGQTVAEIFEVGPLKIGESFLEKLL